MPHDFIQSEPQRPSCPLCQCGRSPPPQILGGPAGSGPGSSSSRSLTILGAARNTVSRSEEHTSELQSRSDLVCRLLLEKKKNDTTAPHIFNSVRSIIRRQKLSARLDTHLEAVIRGAVSRNRRQSYVTFGIPRQRGVRGC